MININPQDKTDICPTYLRGAYIAFIRELYGGYMGLIQGAGREECKN
jgi:hypothetical protein